MTENKNKAANDLLSADLIKSYLHKSTRVSDIRVFDTLPSTNSTLRGEAEEGAADRTVIVASSQTAGRGRLGRQFFSPDGSGIYLSILLRPSTRVLDGSLITPAAAVAVCKAAKACGIDGTSIKWVNDVFLGHRKVCGILTESKLSAETGIEYAIVGIGVNVYPPSTGFPEDIRHTAGYLTEQKEPELRARLAAEIISHFTECCLDLSSLELHSEYKSRCFILGKDITVHSNGTERYGRALDIDRRYRLKVDFGGETATINSGEVSIRF